MALRMNLLAAVALSVVGAQAATLNVLELGAKNDGSADISGIVNAATAKGALYLPAGIYKVSKPLVLKNPLIGAGYARVPVVDANRTWLVSDIPCADGKAGVIEFGGAVRVNVENLNIMCKAMECGIRVADCSQGTATYVDKVGIYNVQTYGFYIAGRGSRPIFAGDMTIFGRNDTAHRSVAIRVQGACDCRFSNIEMMGVCVGMEVYNGHTYCDNLHLWTGVMGRKDAAWWKMSRSIVLGPHGKFSGSEIYPDTSYYAIEQAGPGTVCDISNIMYWEDGSVPKACDRNGGFLKRDPEGSGRLVVHGGLVGVTGTDHKPGAMRYVYSPGETFRDVMMKNDYSIDPANLDRLCLGSDLPDYTVRYATNGFCRVADILAVAKTGACHGILTREDGAAWRLAFQRGADGKLTASVKAVNSLGTDADVKTVILTDHVKVYLRSPDSPTWTARFTTNYMGDYFRPVDHGSLRTRSGLVRYRETL